MPSWPKSPSPSRDNSPHSTAAAAAQAAGALRPPEAPYQAVHVVARADERIPLSAPNTAEKAGFSGKIRIPVGFLKPFPVPCVRLIDERTSDVMKGISVRDLASERPC